jgi:hypothetical protein
MTPFQRSELTDRIVRYLRELPKEQTITYDELSRNLSAPIKSTSGYLISAREILKRDYGQVWLAVPPRVGVVRLNDTQTAERQHKWWLAGLRRRTRRAEVEAEVVNTKELDHDTGQRFAASCIQRQLVADSLSRTTTRIIASRGTSNDLPAFNAVEWAVRLSPPHKTP